MMTLDEALMKADDANYSSETEITLAAEVRRLRTELEQERKRMDWALSNGVRTDTDYGGIWYDSDDGRMYASKNRNNPRVTIDELMEKTK